MNIKPNDLVLEIGSGNSPRERSDIIADRLVHDNSQRAGTFNIVIDRPFVVCDGYNLPFRDKIFDYVICSHVIEHLEDPEAFIKEIMRVGKAGYIEVPSSLGERLFGWDFHLWYCEFRRGKLFMTRKHTGERFGGFFHRLIANTIWFRRFCERYEDLFYIKYEWDTKIQLSIDTKPIQIRRLEERIDKKVWELIRGITWDQREDAVFFLKWMVKRFIRKSKKIRRRILWKINNKQKIVKKLTEYFICPKCKKYPLKLRKNIICTHCEITYEIDKGLPIMLTKKELKKGY